MNAGLPNQSVACPASLPQIGGSGVLVQPMTYIFDEEPARWRSLLDNLGVASGSLDLS